MPRAKLQKSTNGGISFSPYEQVTFPGAGYNPDVTYGGVRMLKEDEDTVFWFGYARSSPALSYNLRKSSDGGLNWVPCLPGGDVQLTDILTSLRCSYNTAALVWFYNRTDNDFYKSTDACTLAINYSVLDAAMDFDLADLVPTSDDDNEFHIGNMAAAATLVEHTADEATSWTDRTGNLDDDTSDAITAVILPGSR